MHQTIHHEQMCHQTSRKESKIKVSNSPYEEELQDGPL